MEEVAYASADIFHAALALVGAFPDSSNRVLAVHLRKARRELRVHDVAEVEGMLERIRSGMIAALRGDPVLSSLA
jgi:hypothetical protein